MTDEWSPRVWHGVVDPETGDEIPPTTCGSVRELARFDRERAHPDVYEDLK